MYDNLPPRDLPRPNWFQRYPLVWRFLVVIVGFVLLIPISKLFDEGSPSVDATGLPGAAIGGVELREGQGSTTSDADPATTVTTEATTSLDATTVAEAAEEPAVEAAEVAEPVVVSGPASTAAATTAKKVATTAKKPVATTAKPVATTKKPVATTAKPVATTKKPVATTAKPVATTKKPVATTAPKPTTTAPKPTNPPTTARPPTYSQQQVIDIIKQVWPDALEDQALWIAKRESGLVPTSRNSCCVGLFALNVQVPQMKTVVESLGFTLSQLTDPYVNSVVAVAIYQRYENIKAGAGWCPWKPLPWSYTCP